MNDIVGALLYVFGLFVVVPFVLFSDWGVLRMSKKKTTDLPDAVSNMLKVINKEQQ